MTTNPEPGFGFPADRNGPGDGFPPHRPTSAEADAATATKALEHAKQMDLVRDPSGNSHAMEEWANFLSAALGTSPTVSMADSEHAIADLLAAVHIHPAPDNDDAA